MACSGRLDFGDFIEQDRAPFGQLEAADPRGIGAGECAPLVAKQFALHELRRKGRAIEADQRSSTAQAGRVQTAGDQLLAGSAFAGDQHRFVGRSGLRNSLPEQAHGGALARP